MPIIIKSIKALMFLIPVTAVVGCAMHAPNTERSLRHTKERLVEAKKNPDQRRDGAQFLYEADLYWQRAWASQNDTAKANHLLYMAQGKLAMAQSVAALRKAERELKQSSRPQRTEHKSRTRVAASKNNSMKDVVVVKANDTIRNTRAVEQTVSAEKSKDIQATQSEPEESEAKPASADTAASSSERINQETIAIQATSPRSETSVEEESNTSLPTPAGKVLSDLKTEAVEQNPKISQKMGQDSLHEMHAALPVDDKADRSKTQEKTNKYNAQNGQKKIKTAALPEKENRIANEKPQVPIADIKRELPEEIEPATSENDAESRKLNAFYANIPAYCRSITAMIRGGKKVEQKCTELEIAAEKRLRRLDRYSATFSYCSDVSRALGAGYQIMELCVEQELGSKPDSPDSQQGYVMGEPNSNTKKEMEVLNHEPAVK